MQIPSLPPGSQHNCSLSSWRQSGGGGCAAKINPIFCSFSVLGCNPRPPPLPLHRWGISWASGSALSRGEGDGQGRDGAGGARWKASVTGLRITASIRPDTLSHLPSLKLFRVCRRQTDRYSVSAWGCVYLCTRQRPKLGWGAGGADRRMAWM